METYPGFTVEQKDGIYIYRIYDITRAAVDAWYEVDRQQSLACVETTRHAMRLFYLDRFIFPTPYFTAKLHQANQNAPQNLYESAAVVIPNGIVFNMLDLFLNRHNPSPQRTARRVFREEPPAIAWLQKRQQIVEQLLQAESSKDDD
ncbi:MAG: hypothetical protein CUN55_09215 [Phototrophicales bacterium]|nr:MAG: hypothetical protein CUN55_09215 [Phototrophicales bacterium]